MNKSEIFDRLKEGMHAARFSDKEKELHLQHYTEKFAGYTDEMLFEEIGKRGGIDAFVTSVINNRNNVLLKDEMYQKTVGLSEQMYTEKRTGTYSSDEKSETQEPQNVAFTENQSSSSTDQLKNTSFSPENETMHTASALSNPLVVDPEEQAADENSSDTVDNSLSSSETIPVPQAERIENAAEKSVSEEEYDTLSFLFGDEPEDETDDDETYTAVLNSSDQNVKTKALEQEEDSFFPIDDKTYFDVQSRSEKTESISDFSKEEKNSFGSQILSEDQFQQESEFHTTDEIKNKQDYDTNRENETTKTDTTFSETKQKLEEHHIPTASKVSSSAPSLTDLPDKELVDGGETLSFNGMETYSDDMENKDDTMQTSNEISSWRSSRLREMTNWEKPSTQAKRNFIIGAVLLSPFAALIFFISMSAVGIIWLASALLIPFFLALMLSICVAGIILSVVGLVYGLSQLFTVKPVGMFEIGLGVMILGATILICTLIYNLAVRVIPKLVRGTWHLVCRTFWILVDLFYYIRGECYRA